MKRMKMLLQTLNFRLFSALPGSPIEKKTCQVLTQKCTSFNDFNVHPCIVHAKGTPRLHNMKICDWEIWNAT